MSLQKDDRLFLEQFRKAMQNEKSRGMLDCEHAARQVGLDVESSYSRGVRLARLGYLTNHKTRDPLFSITQDGVKVLMPWWRKNLPLIISLIVATILAVISWLIAYVLWWKTPAE